MGAQTAGAIMVGSCQADDVVGQFRGFNGTDTNPIDGTGFPNAAKQIVQTGGRRQDAARLLGWGRNTLTRKLKELELK